MFGLSRRQLIIWAAAGLLVLLIGANYLRGHLDTAAPGTATAVTLGLKEEKPIRMKIHVVGAVARPGLYEIDSGSRVADALELAGGAAPSADLTQINLAARMADGQQLVVPEQGAPGTGAATGSGGGGGAPAAGQPVNLNAATVDQLTELDGVGPKTAQKIIDYRDANGGFKNVEELLEVPGIGPAKFEQLKGQVVL
jgi:competence protein ComEA